MTKPQQKHLHSELPAYLAEQVHIVDQTLDKWVPAESTDPASIHKAMRYSLFAGGKRIRPILAIAAARAVSDSPDGIENAAATLELIHTYSLIHDDLPALDNDDLRRGCPTCHIVFGDAMAILAGDSLLTLAFEVLGRLPLIDAERKIRLVEELARASGTVGGMIGGQVNDIEGEKKIPTAFLLESIHRAKTGALLRASLRMGAIYAGATSEELAALSEFGERVGLAFQIIDDVLDVEVLPKNLGKLWAKTLPNTRPPFPPSYGLGPSRTWPKKKRSPAHAALQNFDDRADCLRQIADFIVQRKHEERLDVAMFQRQLGRIARESASAYIFRANSRLTAEEPQSRAMLWEERHASKSRTFKYVSRADSKLEAALKAFAVDPTGKV